PRFGGAALGWPGRSAGGAGSRAVRPARNCEPAGCAAAVAEGIVMLKLSLLLAVVGLALLGRSALPAPAISIAQGPPIAAPTVEALAGSSQIAYGKALFSDKGCVACHHHAAVAGSGTFSEGNPDLTAD